MFTSNKYAPRRFYVRGITSSRGLISTFLPGEEVTKCNRMGGPLFDSLKIGAFGGVLIKKTLSRGRSFKVKTPLCFPLFRPDHDGQHSGANGRGLAGSHAPVEPRPLLQLRLAAMRRTDLLRLGSDYMRHLARTKIDVSL